MSEEAAVFARRNELGDPFPIVPDDEPTAADAPELHEPTLDAAAPVNDDLAYTASASPAEPSDAGPGLADPGITALAGDDAHFLQALIGIAARDMQRGVGDVASLGLVLSGLGQALAEGQDHEETFQELVDTFERRRLGDAALRTVAPIVGLFVARLAAAPQRHDAMPDFAEIGRLLDAAAEVASAALQSGGARAWRRLPGIAMTIAERTARRGLSITGLAEALPRLAARFGLGPRGPVMRVVSHSDHPRPEVPRGEATEKPRRMLISGPVEIVILDR